MNASDQTPQPHRGWAFGLATVGEVCIKSGEPPKAGSLSRPSSEMQTYS